MNPAWHGGVSALLESLIVSNRWTLTNEAKARISLLKHIDAGIDEQ
jgi:hypothetical protein